MRRRNAPTMKWRDHRRRGTPRRKGPSRVPAKLTALLLVLLALPAPAGAATPMNDIGRIAFTSDRDGNNEIYSARVDGDGQMNATNDPATDQSPAVSADGAKIAFV